MKLCFQNQAMSITDTSIETDFDIALTFLKSVFWSDGSQENLYHDRDHLKKNIFSTWLEDYIYIYMYMQAPSFRKLIRMLSAFVYIMRNGFYFALCFTA